MSEIVRVTINEKTSIQYRQLMQAWQGDWWGEENLILLSTAVARLGTAQLLRRPQPLDKTRVSEQVRLSPLYNSPVSCCSGGIISVQPKGSQRLLSLASAHAQLVDCDWRAGGGGESCCWQTAGRYRWESLVDRFFLSKVSCCCGVGIGAEVSPLALAETVTASRSSLADYSMFSYYSPPSSSIPLIPPSPFFCQPRLRFSPAAVAVLVADR